MQVFYGSVEDARNLLMEYASKNPDNPNSHRYLYELETSTSNRPEIREKHLKVGCIQIEADSVKAK